MCRAPIKSISRQTSLVSTNATIEASDGTACASTVELTIENSTICETENNIMKVRLQSGDK